MQYVAYAFDHISSQNCDLCPASVCALSIRLSRLRRSKTRKQFANMRACHHKNFTLCVSLLICGQPLAFSQQNVFFSFNASERVRNRTRARKTTICKRAFVRLLACSYGCILPFRRSRPIKANAARTFARCTIKQATTTKSSSSSDSGGGGGGYQDGGGDIAHFGADKCFFFLRVRAPLRLSLLVS